MHNYRLTVFAVALLVINFAAPVAAQSTDAEMLARAKSWFARLQSGTIDRSQLANNATVATEWSPFSPNDATKMASLQTALQYFGAAASFIQQQSGSRDGDRYAVYLVTSNDGKQLYYVFSVNGQGKIDGLGFSRTAVTFR